MTDKTMDSRSIDFRRICFRTFELLRTAFDYYKDDEYIVSLLGLLLYVKHYNLSQKLYDNSVITSFSSLEDLYNYSEQVLDKCNNDELRWSLRNILVQSQEARSKQNIIEVISILNDINFGEVDILSFLDTTISMRQKHYGATIPMPHELSLMISGLIDTNIRRIFDPYAGLMDLATTMPDKFFVAREINDSTRTLALIRLTLAGLENKSYVYKGSYEEWPNEIFDAIITIPPFGLRFKRNDYATTYCNSEDLAFEYFDRSTNYNGQLITIVPLSFLVSEQPNRVALRKKVVNQNWLDTIIVLPTGIMCNTQIATACVILKKNRDASAPINMFDASNCSFTDKGKKNLLVDNLLGILKDPEEKFLVTVTPEEIKSRDYTWNAQIYVYEKNSYHNSDYESIHLSDVLEPIHPVSRFSEESGHLFGFLVQHEVYDYEYNPEFFLTSYDLTNKRKISEPAILFLNNNEPRPVYCHASEDNPIFISPNVYAYRITNKTIHEGYLCMEMAKSLRIFNWNVAQRPSRRQVLSITIEFPSINTERSYIEQKNLFEEAKEHSQLLKARELGLESLLEQKKQEYINEIRHRKHDMKTPMAQLRSTLKLFESLSSQITGEPSDKLKLYVQRQKKALDILSEIVNHIADEDVFATPEPLDLDEVLSSFQTKDKYTIAYYPDTIALQETGITKPIVMMGKSDLLRLVQNIVENAIKRGFTDEYSDYCLNISLTVEDGFYFIDFSNNGKPLPEGMDKVRYGTKGEKGKDSDGSGQGGAFVKSVTEHYGGDYDVYSEQNDGVCLTHVIVKLPIYQSNE